VSKKNC